MSPGEIVSLGETLALGEILAFKKVAHWEKVALGMIVSVGEVIGRPSCLYDRGEYTGLFGPYFSHNPLTWSLFLLR